MFIHRRLSVFMLALGTLGAAIACSSQASESTPASAESKKAPAASPAAVTAAVLEQGGKIYKTNCAACHGDQGRGDGAAAGVMKPPPTDHSNTAYMSTLTDADIAKIIQMGGSIKGKPLMPSNPQIKGADLDALVAYVRSLSANN